MGGKDLPLGCPQLPIEHARALSLCRSEEGQKERDKNSHRGHGGKKGN